MSQSNKNGLELDSWSQDLESRLDINDNEIDKFVVLKSTITWRN